MDENKTDTFYAVAGDRIRQTSKSFASCCKAVFTSPQRAFLILGLLFGILMLVYNPPFEAMDEQHHFFKTFRVSEGRIVVDGDSKTTGTRVPQSVLATLNELSFPTVVKSAANKQKVEDIYRSFEIPLRAKDKTYLSGWKVAYSPVVYLPQVLGFLAGRSFHLSPVGLLYAGRLFNLLAWLLIVYFAICITPVHKWVFFLLALMPMTVNLAASLSADTLTIAIAFLAIAFFLKLALDKSKELIEKKDIYFLLLVTFLLATLKQPYFLLILLFFAIPARRFGSKKRYLVTFAVVLLLALVVVGTWSMVARSSFSTGLQATVTPGKQLRFIVTHPYDYGLVLLRTLNVYKELYLVQFVGNLGYFTVSMPTWFVYMYFFVIISVAALDKNENNVERQQKLCSGAVFVLLFLAVMTWFYVDWTTYRAAIVDGLQARYIIPIAPLFFLLFYNQKIRYDKGKYYYVAIILFSLMSSTIMMLKLIHRFY